MCSSAQVTHLPWLRRQSWHAADATALIGAKDGLPEADKVQRMIVIQLDSASSP